MKSFIKTLLIIILAECYLIVVGFAHLNTEETIETSSAEIQTTTKKAQLEVINYSYSQQKVSAIETSNKELEKTLVEKNNFLKAIQVFKEVLRTAEGKVDSTSYIEKVKEQQNIVQTAETTVVVFNATRSIDVVTAELSQAISDYENERKAQEEQARAKQEQEERQNQGTPVKTDTTPAVPPPPPPIDWFTRFLNNVHSYGEDSIIVVEEPCPVSDIACASYPNKIMVSPKIASRSVTEQNWVAVHETAHIYQFKVWDQLMNSETYKNLFQDSSGYPAIEKLANCMARAKGITYKTSVCSSAMTDYASGVWNGIV